MPHVVKVKANVVSLRRFLVLYNEKREMRGMCRLDDDGFAREFGLSETTFAKVMVPRYVAPATLVIIAEKLDVPFLEIAQKEVKYAMPDCPEVYTKCVYGYFTNPHPRNPMRAVWKKQSLKYNKVLVDPSCNTMFTIKGKSVNSDKNRYDIEGKRLSEYVYNVIGWNKSGYCFALTFSWYKDSVFLGTWVNRGAINFKPTIYWSVLSPVELSLADLDRLTREVKIDTKTGIHEPYNEWG